ncbi:MAG: hypothetical protein IKB98_03045 [Clostridia bacterium]|nr:hypothetical protein [Clostridia bacterium]
MIISFFGHADFSEKNKYEKPLFDLLCQLCKNANSVEFLLGGYGNFDSFAYNVCLEFKKAKKNVTLTFVTPYIGKYLENRPFLRDQYDQIVYPPLENVPKKFAIIKRNEWMINGSDCVICFIHKTYGGAFSSFNYAKKKNKKVFNIANGLP